MSKKPSKNNEEDSALWTSFIKDVMPLSHEEKVLVPRKHDQPGVKTHYVNRDSYPVLINPKYNLMDKEPQRMKTRRNPNKIHIEGRIDLHGLTQDDAYNQLIPFLTRMQHKHAKWILIVTGKSGILFDMVPKWLDALPNLITSYSHARPIHGGTGALYVTIKNRGKEVKG
ncbi:MAG: Smr/MutS family protein [Alphaproteobacteria bacterium]|nr:Smr/MutS family protein [Alphaproteobacteria bacterium]